MAKFKIMRNEQGRDIAVYHRNKRCSVGGRVQYCEFYRYCIENKSDSELYIFQATKVHYIPLSKFISYCSPHIFYKEWHVIHTEGGRGFKSRNLRLDPPCKSTGGNIWKSALLCMTSHFEANYFSTYQTLINTWKYYREYARNVINNTTHVLIQIFYSQGKNMYLNTSLKKKIGEITTTLSP